MSRPEHGRIVLIEEKCTVCMVCARECPCWCIHISGHMTPVPAAAGDAGRRRERAVAVLDRFDLDWAVCMFCGICVDTCPYDALRWEADPLGTATSVTGLCHGTQQLAPSPAAGDPPSARDSPSPAPPPGTDPPAPSPAPATDAPADVTGRGVMEEWHD